MDRAHLVRVFNLWMQHYMDNPEAFEHEFQTVALFCSEAATGVVPSYGSLVMAYLDRLMAELGE